MIKRRSPIKGDVKSNSYRLARCRKFVGLGIQPQVELALFRTCGRLSLRRPKRRSSLPCPTQKLSRSDKGLNSKRVRGTLRLMLRETFSHAFLTLYHLSLDFTRFLGSLLQSRSAPAAENLFLRKQLALYQERQVQPRRATDGTRLTMVLAARLFDWKEALVSVRPETFTAWHRQGFKLFWRWKSRPIGRPRIPKDLRQSWPWLGTIQAGVKPASPLNFSSSLGLRSHLARSRNIYRKMRRAVDVRQYPRSDG
jgi:hypothetical protein